MTASILRTQLIGALIIGVSMALASLFMTSGALADACATGPSCAAASATQAAASQTPAAAAAAASPAASAQTGNCAYTALQVADSTLSQGIQGILNLVCSYHTAATQMISTISPAANAQMQANDKSAIAISLLVKVFALFVTVMVTYGMVVLTLQVVEIAIRLTVYSVLMPFIVYSYIYESTRYIFDNAVKGYMFVLFKFAFLGVFLAAALLMLKIATAAVGTVTSSLSDLTNTAAIVSVISYSVAAVASTLMTSKLMGSATNAAAAITSYDFANAGIASGAMAALNTGMSVGIGMAGIAAFGGAKLIGADARMMSRLMSRMSPGGMKPFMAKIESLAVVGGNAYVGHALYELYNNASQSPPPLTSQDAPSAADKIGNMSPNPQTLTPPPTKN